MKKSKIKVLVVLSLLLLTFLSCKCLCADLIKNKSNGYFKLLPMTVEPRDGHTATLLQDGKVLITGGGFGTKVSKTAEIYDPKTNKFKRTGDMTTPRTSHASVLLKDGRVLITGGRMYINPNRPAIELKSAEIYNPKTKQFTRINDMNNTWVDHNTTLLNDGRVLISSFKPFMEIYNPITNEFKETVHCLTKRCPDNATLLNDGTVLLASGVDIINKTRCNPQIFDPKTETIKYTGQITYGRSFSTATLLKNGEVSIIGGSSRGYKQGYSGQSEIYKPLTGTFRLTAKVTPLRSWHSSILLDNGKVLVVGGETGYDEGRRDLKSCELYDAQTDKFIKIPDMHYARTRPTLTLLTNGNVLIISNGKRPELYISK